MRHVKVFSFDDIDKEALGDLAKQAVELNREHGIAAMKKGI